MLMNKLIIITHTISLSHQSVKSKNINTTFYILCHCSECGFLLDV